MAFSAGKKYHYVISFCGTKRFLEFHIQIGFTIQFARKVFSLKSMLNRKSFQIEATKQAIQNNWARPVIVQEYRYPLLSNCNRSSRYQPNNKCVDFFLLECVSTKHMLLLIARNVKPKKPYKSSELRFMRTHNKNVHESVALQKIMIESSSHAF